MCIDIVTRGEKKNTDGSSDKARCWYHPRWGQTSIGGKKRGGGQNRGRFSRWGCDYIERSGPKIAQKQPHRLVRRDEFALAKSQRGFAIATYERGPPCKHAPRSLALAHSNTRIRVISRSGVINGGGAPFNHRFYIPDTGVAGGVGSWRCHGVVEEQEEKEGAWCAGEGFEGGGKNNTRSIKET